MPASFAQLPVLTIINNVRSRLGLNALANIDGDKNGSTLLALLNDVLADLADYGDWIEGRRIAIVTATTSTNEFKVRGNTAGAATEVIRGINLVHFGRQTQQMMPQTISDITRFVRASSRGTPRHFAITGVSGTDPIITVYPEPVTAGTEPFQFRVDYQAKHRILVTADTTVVPFYNAKLVEQGLYVRMLLRESGGQATPQVSVAQADYERMKKEELQRFTSDSGDDNVKFTI